MSTKNDGTAVNEETLKLMKLTTEEERDMFQKVISWWEGRSLRLSIQVEAAVGAALITRCLFAQGRKNTQASPQDSSNLASPRRSSRAPFVSPDETTPSDEDEESKDDSGVVIEGKRKGVTASPKGAKSEKAKKIKDSIECRNDTQNQETEGGMRNQFLVSLATDLAALLAANAGRVAKASTPTVAFIASAYYFMFKGKDENKPSMIATDMLKSLIDENATEDEIMEYSLLLQKTLLSLSRAAKASVEAYSDFEYVWSYCLSNPTFREAIVKVQDEYDTTENQDKNENGKRPSNAVSTQEQRPQSMKQLCWALACLVEEKQKESKGDYVTERCRRILNTATCISLLSSLPNISSASGEDDEAEDDDKSEHSSAGSRASKRSRTEDDAIDALSRMVKGRSTPTQQLGVESSQEVTDIIEVIMNSVNDLFVSLRPSFQNKENATLPELEHAATRALELFALSGLIPEPTEEAKSSGESSDKETPDASLDKDAVETSLDEDAADTSLDKETPNAALETYSPMLAFASKVRPLLPTKAVRGRLVDAAAIDEAMSASVKQAVDDLNKADEASFVGLPFVDEASLVSSEVNIIPYLCMASSQASSSGVALISQYDGGSIVSSQDSHAAAAMTSLMPDAAPTRAMRETMELSEWTATILSISDVKPRTRLMLYLEASDDESIKKKRKRADGVTEEITLGGGWRTVMAPLLNRVIARLIDDMPAPGEKEGTKPRVSVSDKDGSVIVHGSQNDIEVKLCKALISLYYQSLEALLFLETARLNSASHPKLIMNEHFHRAALTCSCVCLMKGLCSSSALAISEKFLDLDLLCIQQIMESCPYTYLKVSESFARALKLYKTSGPGQQSPHVLGLPRILQRQLSQCEVVVIDSLLWSQEPNYSMDISAMDIIADIKSMPDKGSGSSWPPDVLQPTLPEELADTKQDSDGTTVAVIRAIARPPDHLYLSYIIRKMLKVAFFRISALCHELSIPPEYPVASQVWIAFRYLLRHNIELLYDRHVDQLILCSLYGVCKIMKVEPELTFSRIIEVYTKVRGTELGKRTCHRIVRHIKLNDTENSPHKPEYGNVIQMYNTLFVPAMKNHLLQSKSLKKACGQLRAYMADPNKKNGAKKLSVQDCEAMAARADKLANDSGNWANEPKSIPVKEGNVKMNVLLPTASNTFDDKAKKKQKKKRKADTSSPENRTFFSFGGASTQKISLMNRMAEA